MERGPKGNNIVQNKRTARRREKTKKQNRPAPQLAPQGYKRRKTAQDKSQSPTKSDLTHDHETKGDFG